MDTGIIILAAGSSSRLGRPKQLLVYNHKTLLQHVIDEAKLADLSPIVVVIGANADELSKSSNLSGTNIIINDSWETGMSSSIAAGLAALIDNKPQNMILSVCDQPQINAQLFSDLVRMKNKTGSGIVASAYAGTLGTPVLFNEKYYDALLNLTGNEGAKKLLNLHQNEVSFIPFEDGQIDIDTEEDYLNLQKNQL